jgi:hypothetical protein
MGADSPNNQDCHDNDGYVSSSPKNNSSLRPLLYRHSSMPVGSSSSSSTNTPQTSVAINYQEEGYESSDSSTATTSSSASIGSFYCGKGGKVHSKPNNNKATKPANNIQHQPQPTIVIANFQPIIEPLEPLHLHSSNIYEPLLHATPEQILQHFEEQDVKDDDEEEEEEENFNNSSKGGGEMLTEYECEVIEMLKQEKAVVKTIRNSDWTTHQNYHHKKSPRLFVFPLRFRLTLRF